MPQSTNRKWKQLLQLQDNRFIRSMYIWLLIVPIFARIFTHILKINNIQFFGVDLTIDLNLPLQWQLFYFSAISFVIANLICFFCSPEIIKKYDNMEDYTSEGKDTGRLTKFIYDDFKNGEISSITETINTIEDFNKPLGFDFREESEKKLATKDLMSWFLKYNLSDAQFFILFPIYFNEINESKPILRFICTIAYALGFVLAGIVFVDSLLVVVKLIF